MELESSEFDGVFVKRGANSRAPPRRRRGGDETATGVSEPQKKQGWGFEDEAEETAVPPAPTSASQARVQNKHFEEETGEESDDMPVIPDLEEDTEEDMSKQVAEAPKAKGTRFQSIHELEHEANVFNMPSMGGGVDISLLQSVLLPQPMVADPDETWDTDVLFTSVAGELRSFNDEKEDDDEQDGSQANSRREED